MTEWDEINHDEVWGEIVVPYGRKTIDKLF